MKLLTWNVQWFRGVDGVVDVARAIAHARATADFDVLCLQEVAQNFPGLAGCDTPFDQVAAVAALLPGYEVLFAPAIDYRLASGGPRAAFGNLVATRLPALAVEHHLLPLLHEAGVPSARRVCISVLLQGTHGPLTVMNTHLEYYSSAQQALQVERLLAIHAENCALVDDGARQFSATYQPRPRTARTILCGDFNFADGSAEHRSLQRGQGPQAFRDVQAHLYPGAVRTHTFGCYDTTYVKTPLACDHVLATQDIVGQARRVVVDGATQLSDHQPVLVEWEGL